MIIIYLYFFLHVMKEENNDIRWKQRLLNLEKAFAQLERFVAKEDLNEMEEKGLIKAFE